ncbi:MAG: M20/M25/M40 family metallo-hydrolase [Gemmatimonadota bacterium]
MRFRLLVLLALAAPASLTGQEANLEALRRAQSEESLVADHLTALAYRFGPRLAGTRSYGASAEWVVGRLAEWGVDADLSSIEAPLRGWEIGSHSLAWTSPRRQRLHAHPVPHTGGTDGPVMADVVVLERPEDLAGDLADLDGNVVVLGWTYRPDASLPIQSRTPRLSDDLLLRAEASPDPNDLMIGYHARRSTLDAIDRWQARRAAQGTLTSRLADAGAVAVLVGSSRAPGLLQVDNNGWLEYQPFRGDPVPPPTFIVDQADLGELVRSVRDGVETRVSVESSVVSYFEPEHNVNVLADLPGVGASDEVVIIGAHLDSHASGSGAADNASGVSVMMEAIRLIQASGIDHDRTIRLALWAGEEGGFFGSRDYVSERVGDLRSGITGAEHERISAVLNLDNGAGRIRGVFAQGNPGAADAFREILTPFRAESGPGDGAVVLQNANQSDHEVFDALGIPAFQFVQDPMGYLPFVHHTQLDVPDLIRIPDLEHGAVLVAYTALALANRPDRLPRRPYHSVVPVLEGAEEFRLEGHTDAQRVYLIGDFNNWAMFDTPMQRESGGWVARIDLPAGRHLYKFIVDGSWTNDPSTPEDALERDGEGHGGLTARIVPERRD